MEDVDKHILVRGLDNETVKIAERLDIPHHEGAGVGLKILQTKNHFKNMSRE
jgi:hypothetical protein